jgi:hypothetical protein
VAYIHDDPCFIATEFAIGYFRKLLNSYGFVHVYKDFFSQRRNGAKEIRCAAAPLREILFTASLSPPEYSDPSLTD